MVHYKAVPQWPKPLLGDKGVPAPWNYWQVSSVAVEKNGNILVLHRGDDPILEYKPDGELIGPWGEVKFGHGKVGAGKQAGPQARHVRLSGGLWRGRLQQLRRP